MRQTLIFILLLFSFNARADNLKLLVGTSIDYFNINDPHYRYVNNTDQLEISSLNVGLSYRIVNTHFVNSVTTNWFLNTPVSREVQSKSSGIDFESKSKTNYIADNIGYQIGKFTSGLFIAYTSINKKLYYQNSLVGQSNTHTAIYGATVSYSYNQDIKLCSSIVAPNKDLHIDTGFIFGVNYYFNIL